MIRPPNFLVHACLLGLLMVAMRAEAADFIFPGIQAKGSAGAGQTVSRGGSSLFYNPANMIFSIGLEPDVDLALTQLSYTYQNADTATYSPVVLTIVTPLLTAGLTWRASPKLVFGLALLPLGIGGSQLINGAPVEIESGIFQALDLSRKQFIYRAALGGAWHIMNHLTAGVGLIYYSERSEVSINTAGTSHIVNNSAYSGHSAQGILGLRGDFGKPLALALSYKSAATTRYSGTGAINTASQDPPAFQIHPFSGVGYSPANIGFGAETRQGNFGVFFDYVRELWQAGRGVYKQGLGADSPQIAFQDTNDIAIGAKLWFGGEQMLEVAFAKDDGNMGNGDLAVSGGAPFPNVGGTQLGQLEAVPRYVASGAYAYPLSHGGSLELAATYLTGSRTVPAGYWQPGTFTLTSTTLSAGASYGF